MALTMTQADAVLKEFYIGALRETLNNEVLLKKYLEASKRQFAGRRVTFPTHTARNSGVGARSESAALPTAGFQSTDEVNITAAYVYGRLTLTGQAKASGKHAFIETLAMEMEKLKDDLAQDVGRQSYGEGAGILAQVSTDSCSTSISVHNQFAKPGSPGARYVGNGQLIDIGTYANPDLLTSATGATVISTTIAANSGTTSDIITISASVDTVCATESFVFNNNAGGKGIEIKGLRCIVDDVTSTNTYGLTGGYFNGASIFSIDRNTVKGWNAVVDANSGTERIIDSYLLQRNFDKIRKASGKDVEVMFGEYDVITAFVDSVVGDRRYASPDFNVGHEVVTFNGKSLVKDLLAPYNELFLLRRDSLAWYTLLDFEWADDDGSILKNVEGFDSWEAFLRAYIQLGAERPNSTGVIRDIRTQLA